MLKVISTEKKPIMLWVDPIEDEALEQARHLANLPFTYKHIALMPDAHSGYGMPIGGVLASEGVVVPNAVGVDIGCGMCAVKTPWTVDEVSREVLQKVIDRAKAEIPVGFAWNSSPVGELPPMPFPETKSVIVEEAEKAALQLGSLGGGNHFIEVQKCAADGSVWLMIHSGSRNLGKKVADYYNRRAVVANRLWHVGIPENWELAYLPIETPDAKAYLAEMNYCVEFALANRKVMMGKLAAAFESAMRWKKVDLDGIINIAHNYATWENHFGQNVLVHRKGATLARHGITGIIPGSQGSKSYIVKGLGNPKSFNSCSHGAGRKMGRKEACRTLDLATEQARLNEQGIIHSMDTQEQLDEAAGAYKDIGTVMAHQQDLVEIAVELEPMAVIKG